MVQDGLKLAQTGPKRAPRWGKLGQDGPILFQMCQSPRIVQYGSKMSQDGPKMASAWPKDGLRCLSMAVFGFHLGPSRALPGFAFVLPSLCLRFAFALPSLCLRFAFALLSPCFRFAFVLLSLRLRFAFALPLLCFRFAFALPSFCICFAFAFVCLCFAFAFRMGGGLRSYEALKCFLGCSRAPIRPLRAL